MEIVDVQKLITKFLDSFVAEHADDSISVEGIVLFGSAISDEYFYKNSDVDVYVVIKNNGKRYRGIKIIDGFEVDYFVNPIEQLRQDFEISKTADKKTVLFMLAEGKIIKDTNDSLLNLQNDAKAFLKKEQSCEMSNFQIHNAKYFINDYIKDIQDSLDNGDVFTWQRNVDLLLKYLVDTFSAHNNILISKPKYQRNAIMSVDKNFIKMYENVAEARSQGDVSVAVENLAKYVINDMGGDLQSEWELKSDL